MEKITMEELSKLYDKYTITEKRIKYDFDNDEDTRTLLNYISKKEDIFDFFEQLIKFSEGHAEVGHLWADDLLVHCVKNNITANWTDEDRQKLTYLYDRVHKWFA